MSASNPLSKLDQAHHLHPFTLISEQQAEPPVIYESANGIQLRDGAGNRYLDAMAGLWCVNVGYGRKEIASAMAAQAERLAYYHSFMNSSNEPAIRLAERLTGLLDDPLNKVFFGCSGSDANDTFVKLAWQYNNLLGRPRKKKILARRGAYHGVTLAAASLGGLPHLHAHFDLPYGERFIHLSRPDYYWGAEPEMSERDYSDFLVKELTDTLEREGPETIAAFIAEPIMGAAGVVMPPDDYFQRIVPILKSHEILVISDEVVCGFGRTGSPWGHTRYEFKPDLVTLAKGLTSGYTPLSACVISDQVWQVLRDASPASGPFGHGFTYTAHPVSAAAALANLDLWQSEDLPGNVARLGPGFQQSLRERLGDHPLVGEIRGTGLLAGVQLIKDKADKTAWPNPPGMAKRLYRHLLAEGLMARPIANTIALCPPMIVTESDLEAIVGMLERGLAKLADELRASGEWSG